MKAPHSAKFLLFDLDPPQSFDPLEADRTINLVAMRLMYATPIEISPTNQLVSRILESFGYDDAERKMYWQVRQGLFFFDGTPLTAEDVWLAVLRMMRTHPEFPVLRDIEGIEEWRDSRNLRASPKGLQRNGNRIEFHFTKPQQNPLFRFTLELFSIVPSACIDRDSGKLLCEVPPSSGYYNLISRSKSSLSFERWTSALQAHLVEAPDSIEISYESSDKVRIHLNSNEWFDGILYGTDFRLFTDGLAPSVAHWHQRALPSSLFLSLLINPASHPSLKDRNVRACLALAYRVAFRERFPELQHSESIFSEILPGYLENDKFPQPNPAPCEHLSNSLNGLRWPSLKGGKTQALDQVFADTCSKLHIKSLPVQVETMQQIETLFLKGELNVRNFGSGFWALDPAGDVGMLFSPGLHPSLNYVTQDIRLTKMAQEIAYSSLPHNVEMKKLNKKLHNDALLNVILHTRRVFVTRQNGVLRDLPQRISIPSLWQVVTRDP